MTWREGMRERLRAGFAGTLMEGVPLARFTTFAIGGPAALLAVPSGMDDLCMLLEAVAQTGADLLVMGGGSNLLVSDRGFDGVVAVVGEGLKRITRKSKDEVYVEAGCGLKRAIDWAIDMEMGGLEDLAGIPGSVGGAICMNAGAMGSSIGELVLEVEVMSVSDRGVAVRKLDRGAMAFGYRESALREGDVVYASRLRLRRAGRGELASRRGEVMAWRRENQPLRQRSAGSVFRNPQGTSAGELIDRCGLKGTRVGRAMVSHKHANFIVNLGGASAREVFELMRRVRDEVARVEGIELEEEIRLVGMRGEERP